jgi:four helix bundle protein
MPTWKRFEEMEVWKKGCRLVCDVYAATLIEPWSKDFALRDQIRRAAISIPSNIAEGFERDSDRAFANALVIAKGSSGELRTQIYIASRLGYLDKTRTGELVRHAEEVSRMLSRIIVHLRKSASC